MTHAGHMLETGRRASLRSGVVRSVPTARSDRAAWSGRATFTPSTILHLQRTAGNASVASLMTGRPVVQRGFFDMLGGLLGGGGGGAMQTQAAGLAGQGVQAGVGALANTLGGPWGQMLGSTGAGLGGVASNLVGGNTGAALSGLQAVGSGVAGTFAQTAMGMLGNAMGGQAGGLVSGLGGAVGQGLSSVISGGDVGQAGMGILSAAAPGLQEMAGKFLSGI